MAGLVVRKLKRCGVPLADSLPAAGLEALKGERAQLIQAAKRKEAIANDARDLASPAAADKHFPKVRVTDWDVLAQIAHPVALWAVRIAEGIAGRINRG